MNNEEKQKLLDQLLQSAGSAKEVEQLSNELFKRGVQVLLNAEMQAHLGYPKGGKPLGDNIRNGSSRKTLKTPKGPMDIEVPRDRNSTFDPVTVPKHKTMSETIESSIMLLYAKGMSTADITEYVEHTYGIKYSTSQISVITNNLLEDIEQWQNRPLEDSYPVVWIDAIHYKIRHEGRVTSRAAMIVLGIDLSGRQDILSAYIVENESATAWMGMLNNLKARGVKDIIFLCSDNLPGLDKAIEAVFPQSIRQICIVHQIRTSLKYVAYKDRKKVSKAIKEIYRADNTALAEQAFEEFKKQYAHKYAQAVTSWEVNWHNLTAFLEYPAEIRKLIYTTNIIESFNASLRKYTRNKKVFPNDQAAMKSIYLAAMQIQEKWNKKRWGWAQIYNQLFILFENRIS